MIYIDIKDSVIQSVGKQTPVEISTDNGWIVVIESRFLVSSRSPGSQSMSGESPGDSQALGEILTGLAVHSISEADGFLTIEFTGGVVLEVQPDEQFESWNAVGPNGERIVCMPGGEMAYWSAPQR
jgi:hypothetical protein